MYLINLEMHLDMGAKVAAEMADRDWIESFLIKV
jgi:hypothetical protein